MNVVFLTVLWKLKSIFNHFLRRFAQVLQVIKMPTSLCIKFNDMHHHIVLYELKPILHQAYDIFKDEASKSVSQNSGIIWTFWWQGYEEMPKLVKECFKYLNRHSNGHKIILITKYNIEEYAHLPNYIFDKVNKGAISLTHLSDILRFNLLDNYGGLWIDSTVFCSSDLTKKYFGEFYTNRVGLDKYHFSISMGRWTGFFIGGDKNLPLFRFMNLFFKLYWGKYNCLIDYFLIDYVLYYVYSHNIGNVKFLISNDDYQPHMFDLLSLMSKKYNNRQYNFLKNDTECFKLTYKKFLNPVRGTYYNYFLNGKL